MMLNVAQPGQIEAFIDAVQSRFGAPLILVNNAGITRDNLMLRMKDEEWNEVIDTDLSAVFRLSRAVIRGMMTGSAPDVYLASYSSLPTIAGVMKDRGEARSLDSMLTKEGKDWQAANYAPAILDLAKVGDEQYAMPFTASLPLLYVNKELVEKAGLLDRRPDKERAKRSIGNRPTESVGGLRKCREGNPANAVDDVGVVNHRFLLSKGDQVKYHK